MRLANSITRRSVAGEPAAASDRARIYPPKTLTACDQRLSSVVFVMLKKIANCTRFVTRNLIVCHNSFSIFESANCGNSNPLKTRVNLVRYRIVGIPFGEVHQLKPWLGMEKLR